MQMPVDHWAWLKSLAFGGIFFGNSVAGEKPMPARIANGDLDGDLYFVCWNEEILSHIHPVEDEGFAKEDPEPKIQELTKLRDWNKRWLDDGQALMGDVRRLVNLSKLVSELYKLWKEAFTDENSAGAKNEAKEFGRGYESALDIGKHGGQIKLPCHLLNNVPEKFHPYIVAE